jgi:AcrR family transcriptional regulator
VEESSAPAVGSRRSRTEATTRASPLPPDQRRAAIIAAALPLLRAHGTDVTTKQIAQAAGVAEGTVFRVFADKDSLIAAVVHQAFDPSATTAALREVDLTLPLRTRLRSAIEIITARLDSVWELMLAMRLFGPPAPNAKFRKTQPPQHDNDFIPEALLALIEPDQSLLRVDAAQAARIVRLVSFGCTHPRITERHPLSSDEIVDLLLDGLRARPDEQTHPEAP